MAAPLNASLDGRVAVITGATRNIGLETAKAFAAAGADLVITARTEDRLEAVCETLRAIGPGSVLPIAGDITDPAAVDELVHATLDAHGGADVVVNNALVSIAQAPSILEAPDEEWDRGLAGYVKGPMRLLRGLVPSMRERGHSSIINLVSTAAFSIVPALGPYGTAKAAMWAATRYLAAELAPAIRVNAVCPGTTSEGGAVTSPTWERILPLVPLARMATPDETAQAVLFLASDASSYTTGQVLFVDGGRVSLSTSSAP